MLMINKIWDLPLQGFVLKRNFPLIGISTKNIFSYKLRQKKKKIRYLLRPSSVLHVNSSVTFPFATKPVSICENLNNSIQFYLYIIIPFVLNGTGNGGGGGAPTNKTLT